MRIFARHIITRTFYISFFVFLCIVLLDFIFSLLGELEDRDSYKSLKDILLFSLYLTPSNSIKYLESACLLGALISLALFHRERALTIMQFSKLAPWKIISLSSIGPLILCFLFLSANELFFYDLQNVAKQKELKLLESNTSKKWFKSDNSFIQFSSNSRTEIQNIKVITFDSLNKINSYQIGNKVTIKDNQVSIDDKSLVDIYLKDKSIEPQKSFNLSQTKKLSRSDIGKMSMREIVRELNTSAIETDSSKQKVLLKNSLIQKIFIPLTIFSLILLMGTIFFRAGRDLPLGNFILVGFIASFCYQLVEDLILNFAITFNFSLLLFALIPLIFLWSLASLIYSRI